MFKRVLLTGDKGFVGNHIVDLLQDTSLTHLKKDMPIVKTFDCADHLSVDRLLARKFDEIAHLDLIIHCGAISDSGDATDRMWWLNYEATKELAFYAKACDAKFLFFSSAAAIDPTTAYGWSKRTAEDVLRAILPTEDLCIFRPFNIWHWHEPAEGRNPSIPYKLFTGQLEKVYKGCVRDFVHIDQVITAVKRVFKDWVYGTFQIGLGKPIEIEDLANVFRDNMPGLYAQQIKPPLFVDECPIVERLVADRNETLPGWHAWNPITSSIYMTQIVEHVCANRSENERESED